jgi:dCTP deaminase
VATLPITLWPGMKIGQLCFFRLSSASSSPYGSVGNLNRYQGQRGPTASRAHRDFYLSPEFARAASGTGPAASSGTRAE